MLFRTLTDTSGSGLPMITIHPHETFPSLLDAMASINLRTAGGPARHTVVIPSLQFGDHLQRCLADRSGLCMGFDFVMPQTFIHRVMGNDRSESAWSKRSLIWRILPAVGAFGPILGMESVSPRDRLALAGVVADRLDQYGHFRPEMIRAWASSPRRKAGGGDEWQRDLWETLRRGTDEPHPAELLADLAKDAGAMGDLARRWPRLHVLGTGSLDPLLVEVLALLDVAGCDINAHVILPTLALLDDLRRHDRLPGRNSPPDDAPPLSPHPLLPSMGRHAIGSFLLLGNLDEQYGRWPVETSGDDTTGHSLLRRLQSDVRSLRAPSAHHSGADGSLRIHACYGPRREMETVRDEILRAFRDIEGLQACDIHIVNTALEDYRPFISAVLQQGGRHDASRLPVRLTEAPPTEGNPLLEGLFALLETAAAARFTASELIELMQLRAVLSALDLDEGSTASPQLRRWIEESGLTRGLGDPSKPGSWSHARDRMVSARWMDHDPSARYPDGAFILPLTDPLESNRDLRTRFTLWLDRVEELLRTWSEPATPSAWAARLLGAWPHVLGASDDAMLEIRPHLDFLGSLTCTELLDAGALRDWLTQDAGNGTRRTSPWGGILCGRPKQLQNLPCRVLIMTGFQDGKFPSRGGEPPWDLLRSDPRAWDRNPRVDDRQQFLDALLTPTDRLVITASTRNPRTLKESPFSSCVDELLRVLAQMGVGREDLVVRHPLQPFSPAYFNEHDAVPPTFDAAGAGIAATLRSGPGDGGLPFSSGTKTSADAGAETIEARQLARFWKDPADEFVRACAIRLPGTGEDDEGLDRLPLVPDGLRAWQLKDAILTEMLAAAPDLERLQAEVTGRRLLPPGDLGRGTWRRLCADLEAAGRAIAGERGETIDIEATAGDTAAIVSARPQLSRDGSHILVWRSGNLDKPRHFLEPWIQAVVSSAAGRSLPSLIIAADGSRTIREAIPPDEAPVHLAALVEGLRRGRLAPLCYSPTLSHECLKVSHETPLDPEALAGAARKCGWTDGPAFHGEQRSPSSLLAWRDRDPFADAGAWGEWVDRIARPLAAWGGRP